MMRPASGLSLILALAAGLAAPSLGFAADDDEPRTVSLSELEIAEQRSETDELRAKARAARLEAIDRLKALIGDLPSDSGDRKAEMLLRLADLYFEEGKAWYFAEIVDYQKRYDECFNDADCVDEIDQRVVEDHTTSYKWYSDSVRLYEAILRGYPRFAKADQATFYLGMTQQEMKQRKEAVNSFKRLVKLYPTSQYVPDAFVMIGEYYFDDNKAFPALQAYLQATNYKDSGRYAYAKYKLAWCYYNVEEYDNAIETMKEVVAFSSENTGQSALRLDEEGLKDLVRFFADAGRLDDAIDYFTRLGRKDLIRSSIKRLGSIYMEQGKFAEAIQTYQRLIAMEPNHPENPNYQGDIIAAWRKIGQEDKVLEEVARLRDTYGSSSAWYRANASDPKAVDGAANAIEKELRYTATTFNKEARELKKARHPRANAKFEVAIDAYYLYMEDYADHKNAYTIHYDFGELLWMLERHEEAYREYMKVVEMDPKGQHSRFCAESAIFAAEAMVKKEGGGDIRPAKVDISKDVKPIDLTEWEQRLVDACAQYARLFPSDKKVEVAIYKAAYLLYSRFHLNDAADLFRDVIAMNPKSQNAMYSANLILDALNIREEWVTLRDTAKSFHEQEGLGNSKFKDEMYGIWSSAAFTVIEKDFEKTGDKGATADAYMAFFEQFPDFDKLDYALNNAAAYYYQEDRVADSMRVRHILVEDERFKGKSQFYFRQVGSLGFDYERLADFETAATWYDLYVELAPEERKKLEKMKPKTDAEKASVASQLEQLEANVPDALYSSAVFHNAMGDWEGALTRYEQFLAEHGADERALDVALTMGRILEDNDEWARAAERFEAFYEDDFEDAAPEYLFFARLHHGRALLEQDEVRDARSVYSSSVSLYDRLTAKGLEAGAHTEFVAEMMFELAKSDFESFMALEIAGCGCTNRRREDKALGDNLKKVTKALVELEATYKAIIDTGAGEWGVASLINLGRAYEDMGRKFVESDRPFYLTPDQLEIYGLQLEDKEYIQVEKAVAAYQLALSKSYDLNLYNENAAFATRRLGELRPGDFPGLRETIPTPGLTADPVRTFEVETSLE